MATESDFQEKRRHRRKSVKIVSLLKMGVYLSCRGYARDISIGGMCLVAPNLFKLTKQSQVSEYIGAHIKIVFPSPSLTVNGTIVWISHAKGEAGLTITSTSNDELWKQMCAD